MSVLTRGATIGWSDRLKAVAEHQRDILGRRVARHVIESDITILDKIVDEIVALDGCPPTPRWWAKTIGEVADRERAMLLGCLLYDVAADIARLEEIAKEMSKVARKLASTGEWALPVDPMAETQPGLPCPVLPKDDDGDHS